MTYTSVLSKQNLINTFQAIEHECNKIKHFGVYLTFILITGVSLNSFLLSIFFVKRELRTPLNKFFIAIIVINLIGLVTEIPLVILSSFNCK